MPDDKSVIEPIEADFDAVAQAMIAIGSVPASTGPTPVAVVDGFLPIGSAEIPCAVLDDIHNTCQRAAKIPQKWASKIP